MALEKPGLALWRALADFRYHLRRFTLFSEEATHKAGIHPQQHQLLLQIAACPDDKSATVAFAAERLGLRHNSTVELVDRCVAEGWLVRREDVADRRCVVLEITAKGHRILRVLSEAHARELNELGPELIRSLEQVRQLPSTGAERTAFAGRGSR